MSWLIPPLQSREARTFLRDVALPLLSYYASAILVLTPNTRVVRLASLPLSLGLIFNAATRLDIAKAYNSEGLNFLNQGVVIAYTAMGMRLLVWSVEKHPYWRVKSRREVTPEFYSAKPPTFVTRQVFADAAELCFNPRGCGWNWSPYLQTPEEIRPTSSRAAFAATTLASLILHVVLFDFCQHAIQSIEPATIDPVNGGSIFDFSLPPLLRYSRSSLLTLIVGVAAYSTIQAYYDVGTIVGVLLLRQDISLWPPLFNAPWLSTSLTEFWAKRWHQLFRDSFIRIGSQPLYFLFGRVAGILGAFTISGILHVFGHWGMGHGAEWLFVGGTFVVNGVGVALEYGWRNATGHRVGGWLGRIWTILWVVGSSQTLVEAWATSGLYGSVFLPKELRLTTYLLGPVS